MGRPANNSDKACDLVETTFLPENLNFRMRDSVNSNAAIQANTSNQNFVLGLKLYISGKITGQNIKYLQ